MMLRTTVMTLAGTVQLRIERNKTPESTKTPLIAIGQAYAAKLDDAGGHTASITLQPQTTPVLDEARFQFKVPR